MKWFIPFSLIWLVALSTNSKGLTISDDLDRLIDVTEPPKTIVSLSPHLTELLFDLGVGQKVVGTVSFSDYPPSAKAITRVGDASALNFERIIQIVFCKVLNYIFKIFIYFFIINRFFIENCSYKYFIT